MLTLFVGLMLVAPRITQPAPVAAASGGASPLTTKGDLYTYSTLNTRLPTSTDGLCLKTNAATGTGLEWGTCAAGGSGLTYAETAWANLGGF
jgi:hypothetical protein